MLVILMLRWQKLKGKEIWLLLSRMLGMYFTSKRDTGQSLKYVVQLPVWAP